MIATEKWIEERTGAVSDELMRQLLHRKELQLDVVMHYNELLNGVVYKESKKFNATEAPKKPPVGYIYK